MIREIIKIIKIRREIKKVQSEIAQIEHYTGVEKNDDEYLPKRYEYLHSIREGLIRELGLF